MADTVYEIDETHLATVEAAFASLSYSLQCADVSMLASYMAKVNKLTGQSLRNFPYLLTEFMICTASWGVGVLIGRYMKYTAFPDMDTADIKNLMEKLFIPISLMLAFLFNEESRRYTDNYQNWQTCIGGLRDHVLYVHYRLQQTGEFARDPAKATKELCDFVAAASMLLTSLKIHGIRRAQDDHTLAKDYVLPIVDCFYTHTEPDSYTKDIDMPKLWKMNMDFYSKFMPASKFQTTGKSSGAYLHFDTGIIKDSFKTLNMIACPTCPTPLYKLLWFLSVFLSAALVWDASDNVTDELVQSFGILFVLYAPYVFSMAGGVRSYHLSAGNIFWKTYAGGLKRLLTSTHELIHTYEDYGDKSSSGVQRVDNDAARFNTQVPLLRNRGHK